MLTVVTILVVVGAALLLTRSNKSVAAEFRRSSRKLDDIHTLVNSNMTESMQSELDATERELALMYEIIDLKTVAGHAPTNGALVAVEDTRKRVADLKARLHDRLGE